MNADTLTLKEWLLTFDRIPEVLTRETLALLAEVTATVETV